MAILLVAAGVAAELVSPMGMSAELTGLLQFVAGAYIAGNVGTHLAGALSARKVAAAPAPSNEEVMGQLADVLFKLELLAKEGQETKAGVATTQAVLTEILSKYSV